MKRVVWATDIHLEFVGADEIDGYCESINDLHPDVVLLGGDTSNAPTLEKDLLRLDARLHCPAYFVLGNHDFYEGAVSSVRSIARRITQKSRWLRWLPMVGAVKLTERTGLIGHDGWADGRLGNSTRSEVMLNDYYLVAEFVGLAQRERFALLNALGDEAANYLNDILPAALNQFSEILLLTHVPPFRESCWHEGGISDDEFLPHFTSRAVGEVLVKNMRGHPHRELTVLCGHTHGRGEARILPNLFVKTGGADYGNPRIQEVITVD